MQCIECGAHMDEKHRYCPGCGMKQDAVPDAASAALVGEGRGNHGKRRHPAAVRTWMLVALLLAGGMLGGALVGGIGVWNARAEMAVLQARYASLEDANAQLTENSARLARLYARASDSISELEEANRELSVEVAALKHISAPFTYYPTSRSEYTVGTVHSDGAILIGFPNAGEDFVWSNTRGMSMQPLFGTGARLIGTQRFEPEDIKVGDIITFELRWGRRIVHQVIEIQEDGVIAKGFNNPEDDGLIPWDSIKTLCIGVIF